MYLLLLLGFVCLSYTAVPTPCIALQYDEVSCLARCDCFFCLSNGTSFNNRGYCMSYQFYQSPQCVIRDNLTEISNQCCPKNQMIEPEYGDQCGLLLFYICLYVVAGIVLIVFVTICLLVTCLIGFSYCQDCMTTFNTKISTSSPV